MTINCQQNNRCGMVQCSRECRGICSCYSTLWCKCYCSHII